jgi:hypothetical protein
MEDTAIKTDLHDKIEHADSEQLKELYGLVLNYFNGLEPDEDWEGLPDSHKRSIEKGLEQADAGLGKSLSDVNKIVEEKYKLNG